MKMTTFDLKNKIENVAISGLTNDQLPFFQWSKTTLKAKHYGHRDLWNFGPIKVKWQFNH